MQALHPVITSLEPNENGVISLHKPQQRPAMNCPHAASHSYATQIIDGKRPCILSFPFLAFAMLSEMLLLPMMPT